MPHFLLLSLALVGAGVAADGAARDPRSEDVAAIRAHVETIFAAYRRKDRDAVRRTHAGEWRGFLTGSRDVLRGIDAYMREAEWALGSPVRIERWSFRDFDVVFYDATGIVSYVADLDLRLEEDPLRDVLRVIDVYHRSDGEWQQVASQVARHPDALAARSQRPQKLSPAERGKLLADREAVWRSFFAGDAEALGRALPDELVAINAGEQTWPDRRGVLEAAAAFRAGGGRLLRLEFPRTEIRVYGETAILYTTFVYEIEIGGRREAHQGRGTEIFVRREGEWLNAGWHLDSGE